MTHPTTCPGSPECWRYEAKAVGPWYKPKDFPSLITYARCATCGYADVTVDMPDGATQTVLLVNAREPGRLF